MNGVSVLQKELLNPTRVSVCMCMCVWFRVGGFFFFILGLLEGTLEKETIITIQKCCVLGFFSPLIYAGNMKL